MMILFISYISLFKCVLFVVNTFMRQCEMNFFLETKKDSEDNFMRKNK